MTDFLKIAMSIWSILSIYAVTASKRLKKDIYFYFSIIQTKTLTY